MYKLSICLISKTYFPTQGTTSLYNHSIGLVSMGHNVDVIASMREGEKMYEIVDGIKVNRILHPLSGINIIGSIIFCFYSIRKILNLINSENIDIIHVFPFSFCLSIVFTLKILRKKAKVLYDIRTGALTDNKVLRVLLNKIKKVESVFFDGVFIIDKMLINLVLNNNFFYIPLGLDLDFFSVKKDRALLSKYGIGNNDIVLAYIGKLSSRRKIEKLIRAFSLALEKVHNIFLLIIGEGSDLNNLKVISNELNIHEKILFLGYIKHKDVPKYLYNVDIGLAYIPIVPYFDIQPPLKTIEYLACSLPVIATRTKGNKRYIKNGINGLLTDDNIHSISKAIVRLTTDDNLRILLSKNARKSVRKYNSKDLAKNFLIPAYRRVIYHTS